MCAVSPEGSVGVEPAFQVLERFDNITFACSSLGGPDNSYQWQRDNIYLSNETMLTLTNLSASDGGVYSCLVGNNAGNETFNTTLFIRPYITLNPVGDTLSFNGASVSFNCEADSFPAPQYRWEKVSDNDTTTTVVVSEVVQELMFEPVLFGEQGEYQCVAYVTTNLTNITARSQSAFLTGECS